MDLTKIDVPFGELPKETKIALFTAWLDGANVEYYYSYIRRWATINIPSWKCTGKYRLVSTKPSIDWSHVDKKFVAMAKSCHGHCLLFTALPELTSNGWLWSGLSYNPVAFASFKPGNCYWKDSLVVRPEGI